MNHLTLNAVANWVLWTSAAASVLALMVWLAHRLLGRIMSARWGYAMWCLILLRLVTPYSPPSEFSVFNLGRSATPVSLPVPVSIQLLAAPTAPALQAEEQVAQAQRVVDSRAADVEWFSYSWLSYLWLTGAIACLLAAWSQAWRLAQRIPLVSHVDPTLQAVVDEERGLMRLARPVAVLITEAVSTPALFGWWRPRLLMPRSQLGSWTGAELKWIIRHELVHVRHHDVLLNWLLIVVQALHWFNPVIWWALKRLRNERELFCDATVLAGTAGREKQIYGGLLIRLTEQSLPPMPSQVVLPILSQKHQLKRRIAMIAQSRPPRYVWVIALLLCVGLAFFTFTRAAEQSPQELTSEVDTAPEAERVANATQTNRAILEELQIELHKLDALIQDNQQRLDELRAAQPLESSPQLVNQLELQRVEAQSEVRRTDLIVTQLRALSKGQRRQAMLTILPDDPLQKLLEQLTQAEQKLAGMLSTYDVKHPEVKESQRLMETINTQIEDRLDGMLIGLAAKRDLTAKHLDELTTELEEHREVARERSRTQKPVFQAQRDLDNLQQIRDALHRRILEGKINLKLPPSARLGNVDLQKVRDDLKRPTAAPTPSFNVLGAVQKPGRYPLPSDSASLVDIIALAGGPTSQAKLSRVKVMRSTDGDARQVFVLDAASMLNDPNTPVFRVRAGDTIYLDDKTF